MQRLSLDGDRTRRPSDLPDAWIYFRVASTGFQRRGAPVGFQSRTPRAEAFTNAWITYVTKIDFEPRLKNRKEERRTALGRLRVLVRSDQDALWKSRNETELRRRGRGRKKDDRTFNRAAQQQL